WHHSQTLPSMSCRPQAFGLRLPTGCVLLSALARSHANSARLAALTAPPPAPNPYSPSPPARAQYSHSASVGSRYLPPPTRFSRSRNAWTSSQLTDSTGSVSPLNAEGALIASFSRRVAPGGSFAITAVHCCCVT